MVTAIKKFWDRDEIMAMRWDGEIHENGWGGQNSQERSGGGDN